MDRNEILAPREAHWLTRFDEDGEPFGEVCHCEIADNHYVSGRLTTFDED